MQHKAKFIYTLFFILVIHTAKSQTAQWIRQAGTGGITYGVSHDGANNCYAAGQVNSPGLFDNLTVSSHFADVYIAKYNSSGIIQWAKTAGGDLIDQANDIATDASGNSYIAGFIQTNNVDPTVTFDNVTLTGHGSYDWFIAKYDVAGNLAWVHNEGSTLSDMAFGIDIDASGNIIVAGEFSSSMTVGGITITSSGMTDVFIAKYDANGSLQWLKKAGGNGTDEALSLITDANGDIAIAGNFQNTATFGSNSVTASGLGDAFIAKYDGLGNNLWVKKGGGNVSFSIDRAQSIATDAGNNFYITGEYSGTATFDNISVSNTGTSGTDIFVAKYNGSGTIQWLHHGGGTHDDKGYANGADADGNTFVSGFADSGPGVVFDSIALPPLGNEYIFLAKYNPQGSILYVKQYAAGSGQDIDVLNNACLYFGGGASKSNSGNEFDTIDLVYVDRGAFTGTFCEPVSVVCDIPTGLFANKITPSTAKLNWDSVPGAISYTVEYRKQGNINWKTKTATINSKKLKNLQPSTTYEYRVSTNCVNGSSAYSGVFTFTTAPLRLANTEEIADINIYPNPVHDQFTIETDGLADEITVTIYDVNGKRIHLQQFNSDDALHIKLPGSFTGAAYVVVSDGVHSVKKTISVQ